MGTEPQITQVASVAVTALLYRRLINLYKMPNHVSKTEKYLAHQVLLCCY